MCECLIIFSDKTLHEAHTYTDTTHTHTHVTQGQTFTDPASAKHAACDDSIKSHFVSVFLFVVSLFCVCVSNRCVGFITSIGYIRENVLCNY